MNRITWDEFFMAHSFLAKMRSTCLKRHVGATFVINKRVIASGYNGAPPKVKHCTPETCTRLHLRSLEESKSCRGEHAERNCENQCAIHGVSCSGCMLYVTRFPCMSCTKMIISLGIKEVVYFEESDMDNKVKMQMLKDANVTVRQFKITPFIQKFIKILEEFEPATVETP